MPPYEYGEGGPSSRGGGASEAGGLGQRSRLGPRSPSYFDDRAMPFGPFVTGGLLIADAVNLFDGVNKRITMGSHSRPLRQLSVVLATVRLANDMQVSVRTIACHVEPGEAVSRLVPLWP